MKNPILHILNFYLYSSLHIGLCCVLLYLFSMQRFGLEVEHSYAVFLLSSTIFTYSIHRIIGMNKVKKFEHQGRFAVISKFRNHIITYAIFGGLTCTYLYVGFSLMRMQLLFLAGVVSILYTLPIFGKSMRLRDFSFIKIFLIAIVWSVVTESIPLYESGINGNLIFLLFLERVAFFVAITIPFDIRDIEVDRTNKVKTLPSVLGRKNSIYIALGLLVYCVGSQLYLYPTILGTGAAVLTYLFTAIAILFIKNRTIANDYYFSGLMDGTIMLPWILLHIIS